MSLKLAYLLMAGLVLASNILVLFPINDYVTWGAFPYPVTFFISELVNRKDGPKAARKVVYVGFVLAAILSFWLATFQIAIASLTAFLVGQLLDISVFNKLRQATWWKGPLLASSSGSFIDSLIFFSIAFWGDPLWWMYMLGDGVIKFSVDIGMLLPFRLLLNRATPKPV